MFACAVIPARTNFTSVKIGRAALGADTFNPTGHPESSFLKRRFPGDLASQAEFLRCEYHGLQSYAKDVDFSKKLSFTENKWNGHTALPIGRFEMTSCESFCIIALGHGQTAKLQEAALEHITKNKNWCAQTGSAGMVCCPGEGAIVPCGMLGKLTGCNPFLGPPCTSVARIAQIKASNSNSDKPGSICFVYCPQHLRTAGSPSEMRVIRAHHYVQIAMQDFLARNPCELVIEHQQKFRAMWADRQEILLACLISTYATRNWMAARMGEEKPHSLTTASPKDGKIKPSRSGKSGSLSVADYLSKAKANSLPIMAAFSKTKPSPASTSMAHKDAGSGKGTPNQTAAGKLKMKGSESQTKKPSAAASPSQKSAAKVTRFCPHHTDLVVPKWKTSNVKRGFDDLAAEKGITGLALFQQMQKTYGKLSPGPAPKGATAAEAAELDDIKSEKPKAELSERLAKKARKEARRAEVKQRVKLEFESEAQEAKAPQKQPSMELE